MKNLLFTLASALCFQSFTQCIVTLKTEMFNVKPDETPNVEWTDKIPFENIYFKGNISVFVLDTSETYGFLFSNKTFEKYLLLETGNVCGSVLSFRIDLSKPQSLKSVWNGREYDDEIFIHE